MAGCISTWCEEGEAVKKGSLGFAADSSRACFEHALESVVICADLS
jgi:hypothetical protein